MSVSKELMGITYKLYFEGVSFFNTRTSRLDLNITAKFAGARITIAKTLNPDAKGRAQKGEKRFDNEHAASFTLTRDECCTLAEAMPALVKGNYVNPDEKDPKRKSTLSFTHFPPGKSPSFLLIDTARDRNNVICGSLKISVIPSKDSEYSAAWYIFKKNEMMRFGYFIKACCMYLDFLGCACESIKNTLRQALFELGKDGGSGNSNWGNKKEDLTEDNSDLPSRMMESDDESVPSEDSSSEPDFEVPDDVPDFLKL